MGVLEYILAGLGPEARRELAKRAALGAVERVGDAVYERADAIREDVERALRQRREREERARASAERRAAALREEREVEAELEALKARIERDRS